MGADLDGSLLRVGEVDQLDTADVAAGEREQRVVTVRAQDAQTCKENRGLRRGQRTHRPTRRTEG